MTAEKQHTGTRIAGARERLPSLTGLRFVAAFLVFGFHLHVAHLLDGGAAGTLMEWVFGQGAVGVSFFFILSGFVLAWSARAVDTPRRFWQRRFAKIYPNHAVTLVAALGVALVTGAGVTAAVTLPNVLLVQAWVPDPAVYYGLNSPSWSLACEALFYALFVPLYAGFTRLPARALWPATGVALGLVWLMPLIAQALPAADRYWFIYVFPPARLPEFAAGMLLALVVRAGRWPDLNVGLLGAVTVVTYLVSRVLPEDIHYVAVTAIPLALLIAAFGSADAAGRPSPWRARWMIWLGETSFAFYLVHQLAIRLVVRLTGSTGSVAAEAAVALACLGIAVLGSWALYRMVEVPGMRLLRPRPVRPR